MFYKDESMAVFVDGYSTFNAAKSVDMTVDYKKLRDEFMRRGKLKTLQYYSLLDRNDDASPIRPLLDWMSYNGFHVTTKQPHVFEDGSGHKRIKGSVDVEMSLDIVSYAKHVDHIVLFSGARDLTYAVQMAQRLGTRFSVASTINGDGFMCADDLRRQADNFIALEDLRAAIAQS
jgi:uncharacterized LabA/DUF88 family protein